eukprot:8792095-Karenia_brevis.AAC.1
MEKIRSSTERGLYWFAMALFHESALFKTSGRVPRWAQVACGKMLLTAIGPQMLRPQTRSSARPQSGHLINIETTKSQPILILLDTSRVSGEDNSQQILSR